MSALQPSTPPVEPFYLDAECGFRFCLFHPPQPQQACRGTLLYLHPLGDELERARHMAHLQARHFASQGYAVLQLDLYGCGESEGTFASARWAMWQADILLADAWLRARFNGPHRYWGCRFGGLLALDTARHSDCDGVLLWHPFGAGRQALNQFLRSATPHIQAQRAQLWQRGFLDVGSYRLSALLARDIDCCDPLADASLPACPVDAFVLPGSRHDANLHIHPVAGHAFWSAESSKLCPALLRATSLLLSAETA